MKVKILITLLFFTLIACEKYDEEAVMTEGEKISKELQSISSERNITTANVHVLTYPGSYTVHFNKPFLFSGQFIVVEGDYYNLNKLQSFEIEAQTFNLYFK
ncbi:hypothetical protein ACT3CD_10405 [Geofilum sp. OHC36d9]|uniref:hypothetical protein n=1 Tax=Geofilum sp. OHC36d9 TaxID=3458413 RepID=UPI0040341686